MRIALDAMGTDRAPEVEVRGAALALRDLPGDFTVALVGDPARIEAELDATPDLDRGRVDIIPAASVIGPGEAPATAVRRKPDSSIVVGLSAHKAGEVDAFVSAGSTGAVMAASLFILRPVTGVDRPSVATVLPTATDPVLMLDAGANVDCKPHQLVQFAHLGVVYAQDILKRPHPRVGLLNIGEEAEKGNELSVEAHRLLVDSGLRFVGNVEGRDVIHGACDVLVTDGFAGNVLLKFYESVAVWFTGLMSQHFTPNSPQDMAELKHALDYTTYGGAQLLGVNGISIICHGGSPPNAIKNAIRVAIEAASSRMVGHIRSEIASGAESAGSAPAHASQQGGPDRYTEGA